MIKSSRLRIERDSAGMATLILNRPEVRNALDSSLVLALIDTVDELASESLPPLLILTGAGNQAFCSGADLRERGRLTPEQRGAHTRSIATLADKLETYPMPTIAAVNGFALAGGAELAIACDLRIADAAATFGFPEVKVGIFPGAGGVLRLPRLVRLASARELLFTGRRIGAEEAKCIGLVNRVVPEANALLAARDVATQIAANAPLAIRGLKAAMREASGLPDAQAAEVIARYRHALDDTEDYAEGLAAFAERRQPRFVGR